MRRRIPLFALFLALAACAEMNPEWTTPLPSFELADNLCYVGSEDLAAYLFTTAAGNILVNASFETSPLLVNRFYGLVRVDVLLGPIFNDVAQVDWPASATRADGQRPREVRF